MDTVYVRFAEAITSALRYKLQSYLHAVLVIRWGVKIIERVKPAKTKGVGISKKLWGNRERFDYFALRVLEKCKSDICEHEFRGSDSVCIISRYTVTVILETLTSDNDAL